MGDAGLVERLPDRMEAKAGIKRFSVPLCMDRYAGEPGCACVSDGARHQGAPDSMSALRFQDRDPLDLGLVRSALPQSRGADGNAPATGEVKPAIGIAAIELLGGVDTLFVAEHDPPDAEGEVQLRGTRNLDDLYSCHGLRCAVDRAISGD